MLPPSPQIFHGRDLELQETVKILVEDSARISILGTGGIGKTSLATAALHHSQVEAKYSRRYFVPCHSSPTCAQLVSTIADHIGLEQSPNLAQKIIHYLDHSPTSLLVLDNLETPWESVSSQSEVEEFLSLLTDVAHLGLMITMRGAERPGRVKWTRPFLPPLDPLSTSAALQTFIDVADDTHHQASVKQLLELTGNLPLAVSLISSVASHEGCDTTLSRWRSENTHMLSDGYDKQSSLDISIMLSFTGSRMTAGAQDLLSLLSMLPDGLADIELVQARLPIPEVLACKSTLIRTSLAFIDKDQRLKVLVPIREHTLRMHPPTNSLKERLQQHFHDLLNLWNQFQYLNPTNIAPQLFHNLGNFDSVLQDVFEQFPDDAQNIQSILFLNRFYHRTQMTYTPLLSKLTEKIAHLEDSPIFGDYLLECFERIGVPPTMDTEKQIIHGNEYFRARDPLEQGETFLLAYSPLLIR
ncbi:P-loop containing nucleoside triphosphate hydrolase protein [Mycena rebaudengoi]|nr:P-loop containing nucleoside triphosphate hydrolase protein [Mycena rebaudengoi]